VGKEGVRNAHEDTKHFLGYTSAWPRVQMRTRTQLCHAPTWSCPPSQFAPAR